MIFRVSCPETFPGSLPEKNKFFQAYFPKSKAFFGKYFRKSKKTKRKGCKI